MQGEGSYREAEIFVADKLQIYEIYGDDFYIEPFNYVKTLFRFTVIAISIRLFPK